MPRVSIVIPCFDEAEGLRALLPQRPAGVDEIIVVDNGSSDDTADVARAYGARVVREARRGVGFAYQRGFAEARGDIIACLDGDGTYPLRAVESLCDTLTREHLDFLTCRRFPLSDGGAMSWRNQAGNLLLTWAANRRFRLGVRDIMSGMWLFRRGLLGQVRLREGGVPSCIEIKLAALLNPSVQWAEVHIPYARRAGRSKLAPWRDGWQSLQFLLRYRRIPPPHLPRSEGQGRQQPPEHIDLSRVQGRIHQIVEREGPGADGQQR
jgi:hypothetical protein